jgi:MATE family multidrug resistance protein
MPRDTTASVMHANRVPGGYREVSALAFPVALSMLSQTMMWLVDTSFLGRLGTVEQGAAGFAGNCVWLLLSLFYSLSTGVNIFVAQYHGAQTPTRCGLVTWQGLYLSLFAWLPLLVCGLYARQLVQFIGLSPALLEPAATYMRLRLLGALPALCSFTLLGFFRGIGDMLTPLWVTALTNSLNVVLDYLLIFGHAGFPPLGVAGAAWATVLSTAVGSLLYFGLFWQRGRRQGLLAQWLEPFTRREAWRLLRVSLPVGFQGMLESSAWTLFTVFVARLGAVEAAAHQIALSVLSLAYMLAFGVAIAATTLGWRHYTLA